MSQNDREYFPPSNLPDWLKDFADKELKQGTPFEEIKNIFKQKDDVNSVEAKVEELRKRIGLDKIAKEKIPGGLADNQPDEKYDQEQLEKGIKIEISEHTKDKATATEIAKDHLEEAKDFKDGKGGKYYDKLHQLEKDVESDLEKAEANLILGLVSLAIQFEGLGKVKIAMMIDKQIEKIAKKSKKKHEKIKKHIDNVCTSRKGFINAPALLDIIKSHYDDLDEDELNIIREYIKKALKKEKKNNKRDDDDDRIGMIEVHVVKTTDNDDGNTRMYDEPSKI